MKRILITGSTGLIGSRIVELLAEKYTFIPLLQSEVDITDHDTTARALNALSFDYLLHLAAYTNVDGAEQERELCRKINVDATANLLTQCKAKGARMIHISTDFVFDGKKKGVHGTELPIYTEASEPNPIAYYGQSKYEAEQAVKGEAMIVRLSYPYRKSFDAKRDFVRTIRYLLEQGKTLTMVQDSLITPTFIDDIVNGLDYLIQHYSTDIYHLVGAESITPYDAGKLIARTWHINEKLIQPVSYAEYFKGKALRPQWARIVSTKGITMQSFAEGLKCLNES